MYELLTGLRVIEVADSIAARYAGRLLADLGAEVIRLETSEPRANRRETLGERLDDYLSVNKLSAKVNVTAVSSEQLAAKVVERGDIILHDRTSEYFDLHLLTLGRYKHSPAVLCVVTPWGIESPYAHLCYDELLLFSLAGIALVTPEGAADKDSERPMQLWGHQASFAAGIAAASAALQASFSVKSDGQSRLVDVAILDVLLSIPVPSLASAFGGGKPVAASSQRTRTVPGGLLRCQDGYVYTQGGDDNWDPWTKVLGRDVWPEGPYPGSEAEQTVWTELRRTAVEEWLAGRTKEDAYRACQAAGIVAFPVNSVRDAASDPQTAHRGTLKPILAVNGESARSMPRTPIRVGGGPVGELRDQWLRKLAESLE